MENGYTEIRGHHYRLVRGKGYAPANWWVLSKDGKTEVAGGLLYDDARRIFDSCEGSVKAPGQVRASMNTKIIDLEAQQRNELRERTKRRVVID
jgi:hypothetical protein